MKSKFAITFSVGALAATAVWAGYLHHRIKEEVTTSWDQGLQDREQTLRELRVLERLLQDGQVGDATVELQRIRTDSGCRTAFRKNGGTAARSPPIDREKRPRRDSYSGSG